MPEPIDVLDPAEGPGDSLVRLRQRQMALEAAADTEEDGGAATGVNRRRRGRPL